MRCDRASYNLLPSTDLDLTVQTRWIRKQICHTATTVQMTQTKQSKVENFATAKNRPIPSTFRLELRHIATSERHWTSRHARKTDSLTQRHWQNATLARGDWPCSEGPLYNTTKAFITHEWSAGATNPMRRKSLGGKMARRGSKRRHGKNNTSWGSSEKRQTMSYCEFRDGVYTILKLLHFFSICISVVHFRPLTHTHTHTRLTALFPGLPGWACTRKVKPIWILLKQERVSGSDISWAICKSAPRFRQITTPAPHHSVFTGRMPFLPPNERRQSTGGNVYKSCIVYYLF